MNNATHKFKIVPLMIAAAVLCESCFTIQYTSAGMVARELRPLAAGERDLGVCAARAREIYMAEDGGLVSAVEGCGYNFSEVAGDFFYQISMMGDFALVYSVLMNNYPELAHPPAMPTMNGFRRMADFTRGAQAREFLTMLGRIKAAKEISYAAAAGQLNKTIAANINPNHPATEQGPFLDLASGTNPVVYFRNLSADRKYLFVDTDPFVIAYLDQAKKILKVEKNVEIIERDVITLRLEPDSIGTLRMKNMGSYVDVAAIPDGWYEQIKESMLPGGQIIIEFRPNKEAGQKNNPIVLKLRQLLKVEEGGWGFKWGHFADNVFIENETGSEVPGLYSINTVVIFTKPHLAGGRVHTLDEIKRPLRNTSFTSI